MLHTSVCKPLMQYVYTNIVNLTSVYDILGGSDVKPGVRLWDSTWLGESIFFWLAENMHMLFLQVMSCELCDLQLDFTVHEYKILIMLFIWLIFSYRSEV